MVGVAPKFALFEGVLPNVVVPDENVLNPIDDMLLLDSVPVAKKVFCEFDAEEYEAKPLVVLENEENPPEDALLFGKVPILGVDGVPKEGMDNFAGPPTGNDVEPKDGVIDEAVPKVAPVDAKLEAKDVVELLMELVEDVVFTNAEGVDEPNRLDATVEETAFVIKGSAAF